MKLIKIARLSGLAVVLLIAASCYRPQDTVYLDELDITLTYYENTFDFQQYNTFALRDSVGLITNYLTDEEIADFYKNGGANDQIRSLIRQKFQELGYTEVTEEEEYDFGVNMVAMFVNTTTIVGYPGWWYGYGGYYGWYGGWWYPWYGYPWYYTAYQYQTGTILLEMADGASLREYQEFIDGKTDDELDMIPPEDFPEVLFRWQGLIQGVLGSTADYNKNRGERGINEAFAQSPYLQKN